MAAAVGKADLGQQLGAPNMTLAVAHARGQQHRLDVGLRALVREEQVVLKHKADHPLAEGDRVARLGYRQARDCDRARVGAIEARTAREFDDPSWATRVWRSSTDRDRPIERLLNGFEYFFGHRTV